MTVDGVGLLRALVFWSAMSSGCGDDTPSGSSAGTGGRGGLGGSTGGAGGMAGTDAAGGVAGGAVGPIECPAPSLGGPNVVVPLLAEDPPVVDGGGPLVDGLYFLTQSLWYGGPDAPASSNVGSYRDTLVIAHAATGIARVTEVTEGGTVRILRFTMRSAGSKLEVSDTCPEFVEAKYTYWYTATGATLTLAGGERVVIYTRQE